MSEEMVIACDLSVFTPQELEHHFAVCDALFGAVREVRDLPSGYAFGLPVESSSLSLAVDFIGGERRCCPFEAFELHVEPNGGAVWLHVIEPEGMKAALVPELLTRLNLEVIAASGLSLTA
jgi:hypothetical protein